MILNINALPHAAAADWCGIANAEYDAAVELALSETDESKRAELYSNAQRLLTDFNALYGVCDSAQYNITASKVKGFDFRPDLSIRYEKVFIEE